MAQAEIWVFAGVSYPVKVWADVVHTILQFCGDKKAVIKNEEPIFTLAHKQN
jgi:hypothetical protein